LTAWAERGLDHSKRRVGWTRSLGTLNDHLQRLLPVYTSCRPDTGRAVAESRRCTHARDNLPVGWRSTWYLQLHVQRRISPRLRPP